MSITDELREYVIRVHRNGWFDRRVCDDLLEITDRIDAEHERMYEALTIGMEPMTEENMARNGWVKLPVDADGEYIHIGDRMENNERVARIVLTDESWEPSVYLEKLPNVLHEYFCNEISHYHAPTVEDVLREFAEKITDSQIPNVHPTYEEAIAEYASKLRLAGDAE